MQRLRNRNWWLGQEVCVPVAESQVVNPWSSESPLTPFSCVEAPSVIGTWSPSWPVRCHLPPSTHLPLLVHLHRLPSWSRRPRRGATAALQTDASAVSVTAHDPSCSSWNVGWSSHFQRSMGHRERRSGHWSGAGEWQVKDRVITARGGKIILQDELGSLIIASSR